MNNWFRLAQNYLVVTRKLKISTESHFKKVMAKIEHLLTKNSSGPSETEKNELRRLAIAVQEYEQKKYVIDPPSTLEGIIEMKMFELKLKQKELAKKLNISDTKLSMIMSGKQKPDVPFLKAIHQKLNISGDLLLKVV